jgi:hypothetical protein
LSVLLQAVPSKACFFFKSWRPVAYFIWSSFPTLS